MNKPQQNSYPFYAPKTAQQQIKIEKPIEI